MPICVPGSFLLNVTWQQLRHLHIAERTGDPEIAKMPRLEQALRGVKLTQAKDNKKGFLFHGEDEGFMARGVLPRHRNVMGSRLGVLLWVHAV